MLQSFRSNKSFLATRIANKWGYCSSDPSGLHSRIKSNGQKYIQWTSVHRYIIAFSQRQEEKRKRILAKVCHSVFFSFIWCLFLKYHLSKKLQISNITSNLTSQHLDDPFSLAFHHSIKTTSLQAADHFYLFNSTFKHTRKD